MNSPGQEEWATRHQSSGEGTLTGSEDINDDTVSDNSSETYNVPPSPTKTSKRERQESWLPNQLSPCGEVFDLAARKTSGIDEYSSMPCEDLPSEERLASLVSRQARPGSDICLTLKSIEPCFPTQRNRYDRNITILKNERVWKFQPKDTLAVHDVYCDKRWSPNTHPEGQLYFESSRTDRQGHLMYLTEEHLYEQEKVEEIERFIEVFEKTADGRPYALDMDIFVSLNENGEEGWYYYCVDTNRRCLFWFDEVDLTWMAETVGSLPSKAHFRYALDYEYWIHVEHFPFHQEIPNSLIHDLLGVAIHASVDSMTSLESTFPYSKAEAQELVGITNQLLALKQSGYSHGFVVVSAARLMTIFVNERFFNFAGQNGARLTRFKSIRGQKGDRTIMIRLVSPILLYTPEKQLKSLEEIYVDGTIKSHPWKCFVERLEEDWMQCVLFGTVLIAADASFLAVPIVLPNNGIPPGSSAPPAVVAIQISLITAMGSIIVGLLLIHEHRKRTSETAEAAADLLRRRWHRSWGLEALAISYSLPFALLMWSVCSFLVALGILCFDYKVNGIVPTILYTTVSGLVLLMALFTFFTLFETWFDRNWRRIAAFKRLPLWRKKSDVEAGEEADRRSVTSISSPTDSIRTKRSRMRNILGRWRKGGKDREYDLEQ